MYVNGYTGLEEGRSATDALVLSRRRALAIRGQLQQLGVQSARLQVKAHGRSLSARPILARPRTGRFRRVELSLQPNPPSFAHRWSGDPLPAAAVSSLQHRIRALGTGRRRSIAMGLHTTRTGITSRDARGRIALGDTAAWTRSPAGRVLSAFFEGGLSNQCRFPPIR